ncbi:MAG: EAL domain-containing protein [Rhodoferax sp.]|nr:EAL domain-containing protein [Rhodoferax sp.]
MTAATLPLLLNATISLIMGVALLLVWRRNRAHMFTRLMGWSNIVQLLVPVFFWLYHHQNGLASTLGALGLPLAAAANSVLLVTSALHLAGVPMRRRSVVIFALMMLTIFTSALFQEDLRTAQAISATLYTSLALFCATVLWRQRQQLHVSAVSVGPLLVALGLIQFIYVGWGDAGVGIQATLSSVLRLTLGLVLISTALQRSVNENLHLRRRFERITDRSHQGIVIRQGETTVYANQAALDIYGAPNLEALSNLLVSKTIPKDEVDAVRRRNQDIETGVLPDATYEADRVHANGTPLRLRFHSFSTEWDGKPALQILISDETEKHRATQALLHQALHDDLTGLPNRAALMELLRQRCTQQDTSPPFALLLLDLDRFKLFNEAHGHAMGDAVLIAVGQTLARSMPAGHTLMRLGEDEFAVVSAPGLDTAAAVALAHHIEQVFAEPLMVGGGRFFLDASLGLALFPSHADTADKLLRAANAAVHVAKRTPGTTHTLADQGYEHDASQMLAHEQALRVGLERHEFTLAYQPKVDSRTSQLTSFEALARWNRPGVGPVSPAEFVAAAERTGLIGALGLALLHMACQQIAIWQVEFGRIVPVAVNVSPFQLLNPDFPAVVQAALQEHGVDPRWLTLEITESSAIQNLEQTIAQVAQLHAMGIHVALDDFGTGYSSLNMLRTLRLHTVKIDRGLVDPLPAPESIAVVQAICQLAQALSLRVVAEGVETIAQAEAARDAGCGVLQGYLYSKPLPPAVAGEWLGRLTSQGS